MIYITQCLCPKRHCIMAIAFDSTDVSIEDAELGFAELVKQALATWLRPRCEICNANVEFHYETGRTRFETIDEAEPFLKANQEVQLRTRETLVAARN